MLAVQDALQIRNALGEAVALAAIDVSSQCTALAPETLQPPTTFLALLIAPGGSTGKDYSVGAPEAPLVGSFTFGGSSAYATWQLLQTVPANTGASERTVRNNSTFPILVVLDDGSTDGGSTPIDSSVFIIYPPTTSAPNPEPWRSERFKGRVRVFAPEMCWVTITEA